MRLRGDADLEIRDDGRVLVGGSPLRIVRLSDAGARLVRTWFDGHPVGSDPAAGRLARRLLDAGMVHPSIETAGTGDEAAGVEQVTVILPVRDDPDRLDTALASLGGAAAIVVDDGSCDGRAHAAVAERHGAICVRRPTSGGPGAARNLGLARVGTPFVAFVDADVVLADRALAHLMAHLADPRVVAVAPRVRSRTGEGLLARYESVHSPLDLGARPSPVGPGRRVSYVPSAVLLARVDAMRSVGGFEQGLRWGEDVDLVWRLVAAGHVVRYEPRVTAWHEPRASWLSWLRQRRRYGASTADLAIRHGAAVAPVRCSGWSVAVWVVGAAGRPVAALGVASASVAALATRLRAVPEATGLAARLAGRGHLHAGLTVARAVGRAWWPIAATVALRRRRLRPVLVACLVGPPAIDWLGGSRPAGPVTTIGLRVLDDLAHGAGVWEGMMRRRSLVPIVPASTGGRSAPRGAASQRAGGGDRRGARGRGRGVRAFGDRSTESRFQRRRQSRRWGPLPGGRPQRPRSDR